MTLSDSSFAYAVVGNVARDVYEHHSACRPDREDTAPTTSRKIGETMTERRTALFGARWSAVIAVLLLALSVRYAPGTPAAPPGGSARQDSSVGRPTGPLGTVFDHLPPGPPVAPPGAATVQPTVDLDLSSTVEAAPPGPTFWQAAPGRQDIGSTFAPAPNGAC